MPRRLDELRATLELHVEAALSAAEANYRTARICGTFFLALGLALATAGNFVQ